MDSAPEKNVTKRVVIVDDEEDVVLYLSMILTDHGYEVQSAGGGREGLALIKQTKPDLVCLDILMPIETGLSLFKKVRTDPELEDLPVIIISGMDLSEKMADDDEGVGAQIRKPEGYLEKPVKPEQLLETVKAVIG